MNENENLIIKEYNKFKHIHSKIDFMTNYTDKYDFYDKGAIFVIFVEYIPETDKIINPIHYTNYWGNSDFNGWLDRNNLCFDWYDSNIILIYADTEKGI